MRKYAKTLASLILIPLTRWYLRKERSFTYEGIKVKIHPGVFHPGFFYSTRFLLEFLKNQDLNNSSLLELGCGTGLISLYASKKGAKVTASDISESAIRNAQSNAALNNADITFIKSDLFENLTGNFDWVIINPPYYAENPVSEDQFAWYCGDEWQYFTRLFSQLPGYTQRNTKIIMVLSKVCDIEKIRQIANGEGLDLSLLLEKRVFFDEKDYIFQIVPINSTH